MKGTRSGSFYDRSGAVLQAMVAEGLIKPQENGETVEEAQSESRRFKSRSIAPMASVGAGSADISRLLNDAGDEEFINPETRDLGSDAIAWRELVQRKDRYIDALMHRTAKLVSKFVNEAEKLQADLNRQRKERGILEEKVKELQYYVDKAPARAAMLALRNLKMKNALTNEGFGMLESLPVGGMIHHSTLVMETADNLDDNFQRTAFIAAMREQEDKIAELEALLAKEKEQGTKMLKRFDLENLRYKIALGTMTRLTVVTKRLDKDIKEDDFLGGVRTAGEWKENVQELLKAMYDVMNAKDASERDRAASNNSPGGANSYLDDPLPVEDPLSPTTPDPSSPTAFLTETSTGKGNQSELTSFSRSNAKLTAFGKKKVVDEKTAKAKSSKGSKGGKGKPLDLLDILKGEKEKEVGKDKHETKEGVSYVWSQLAVAREKLKGLKNSITGVRKDVTVLQTNMQYWIFGIVNQVTAKVATLPLTRRESNRLSILSLQSSLRRGTVVSSSDVMGMNSSGGGVGGGNGGGGKPSQQQGKQVTIAESAVPVGAASGELLEKILEERKDVIRRKSLAAALHSGELPVPRSEADGAPSIPFSSQDQDQANPIDRRRPSVGPSLLSNISTYTSTSTAVPVSPMAPSSPKPSTSVRLRNDSGDPASQALLQAGFNPSNVTLQPSTGHPRANEGSEHSNWTEEERLHAEREVENLKKELDSVKAEKAEIQAQRQQLVELLKQQQVRENERETQGRGGGGAVSSKPVALNPDMLLTPTNDRRRLGKSPSKQGTRVGLSLHSVDVDKQEVPPDSPGQAQAQFNKLKETLLHSDTGGDFSTAGPFGSHGNFTVEGGGGAPSTVTRSTGPGSGVGDKPLPQGALSPEKPPYPWLTGSHTPRSHPPTSTKKVSPASRQQSSNAQDSARYPPEGTANYPLSTEFSHGNQNHDNYGSLYPVSNVLPTQVRVVGPVESIPSPSARSGKAGEPTSSQAHDSLSHASTSASSVSSCKMCQKEVAQYCVKCLLIAATSHKALSTTTATVASGAHADTGATPHTGGGDVPSASTDAPVNSLNPDELLQALEKELYAREQQVRDKEMALTRKVSVSFVKWVGKGQVPPPDLHSIRYRTTKEDASEEVPDGVESPRDGWPQDGSTVSSPNTRKVFTRRVKGKNEQNLQVSGLNLPPIRQTFLPTPTAAKAKTAR